MNSVLKTFSTILVTAALVGIGTYAYVKTDTQVEETPITTPNIVQYSRPESGIALQFELPEGYGAVEDTEGEGLFQVKYYIGKMAPESGKNVLRSSLSVADYVKIIPSYDSEIITLEDWRATGDVYDGSDALETKDLMIAGVSATVSTFPAMGETWVVQFVKDKNYYEIHVEGSLEDEPVARVIDTFGFAD